MLRLVFSEHATRAMHRRQISVADVRAALENRHTTYPGTNPRADTLVVVGTVTNGRDLSVVVRVEQPSYVVTAFWRSDG